MFVLLVLTVGILATHVWGKQIIASTERWIQQIPLVRSIYLTIKGMTDLFQFRPYSGPLPLAPKPVERIAEWKARPLRAGASVGSSMRSFANGICAKLTTVANFKARLCR